MCRMAALGALTSFFTGDESGITGNIAPRYFAEKVCEHHYSACKAGFRGTPSVRDGIIGTHRAHLNQLRSSVPPAPSPVSSSAEDGELPMLRFHALFSTALRTSAFFFSCIVEGRSAKSITTELGLWWHSEGYSILGGQGSSDHVELEGEDEELDSDTEEFALKADTGSDKDLGALQSMEDSLKLKEVVRALEAEIVVSSQVSPVTDGAVVGSSDPVEFAADEDPPALPVSWQQTISHSSVLLLHICYMLFFFICFLMFFNVFYCFLLFFNVFLLFFYVIFIYFYLFFYYFFFF